MRPVERWASIPDGPAQRSRSRRTARGAPAGWTLGCKDPPTNGGLHASATAPGATARSRRGVAELLHMLRRDTIIIGGGATNRGVETSVREAFNFDLTTIVVRECCWSGDAAAHAYSLDKAMKMYARIRHLDQVLAMLRE